MAYLQPLAEGWGLGTQTASTGGVKAVEGGMAVKLLPQGREGGLALVGDMVPPPIEPSTTEVKDTTADEGDELCITEGGDSASPPEPSSPTLSSSESIPEDIHIEESGTANVLTPAEPLLSADAVELHVPDAQGRGDTASLAEPPRRSSSGADNESYESNSSGDGEGGDVAPPVEGPEALSTIEPDVFPDEADEAELPPAVVEPGGSQGQDEGMAPLAAEPLGPDAGEPDGSATDV
jgi:hypothetical protein